MKSFIKKYMIAGILVVVPVVATIWVLKTLIVWLDGLPYSFLPYGLQPETIIGFRIPGIGLFLTIALILLAGVLTRVYIGKKLIGMGDKIFERLPFGRAIYQATKQVLQSTLNQGAQKSRRVVLVEFPKTGSHALGFLTGKWRDPHDPLAKDKTMVFVPTAPNPTSGFLLFVDDSSIVNTNLSPEEATKLIISGGLLTKGIEGSIHTKE